MSHTEDFEKKRIDILNCAEELFVKRSYELTTVNAILKEVGIAKGTFYYYFKSKEEVMDAVIMRIIEGELLHVSAILANQEMSAIEKLMASFFTKIKSTNKKVIVEQLYKGNNSLMKQRAMQRTLEILCPIYAEIIIEGNMRGDFASDNPLSDVQFLIAGVQTLYDFSNISNTQIELNMESVLTIFFHILRIDEAKITQKEIKDLLAKNIF